MVEIHISSVSILFLIRIFLAAKNKRSEINHIDVVNHDGKRHLWHQQRLQI